MLNAKSCKLQSFFTLCGLLLSVISCSFHTSSEEIQLSRINGVSTAAPEDGYRMWLRYDRIADSERLQQYRSQLERVVIQGGSPTMDAAKKELELALNGLLDTPISFTSAGPAKPGRGTLVVGTPGNSEIIASLQLDSRLDELGSEGFIIEQKTAGGESFLILAAKEDIGILYGVFHLLRMVQTHQGLDGVSFHSAPRLHYRMQNHWDDLNRNPVRGYAGISLWEWGTLPEYRHPRYTDYARVNASLGINATALNNVNADARALTPEFLEKVQVLADIFRPYGIRVFFSVNFNSPVNLGDLETADPLDPGVRRWWKERADTIYSYIPDFGGFLVKADSEGQPGPQGYGRDHAEGANMLAEALEPHGGVVMWRAFVYERSPADHTREYYDKFAPLDGRFADNVIVQVKNGPIDFQPREPFTALFGALPQTNTMMEIQVSQEYFGFANHLAYKGPVYTEALNADTYAQGEGSTVGRVIDGSVFDYKLTGLAGVVNPGTDRNWTGHPFVQSGWYAFGRLAWDHTLSAEKIAEEWIRMTFTNGEHFVETVKELMMVSREAAVNYRTPLGLNVLTISQHYGPGPWNRGYWHRADSMGIGFDRTATGSNAVAQYHEPVAGIFGDPARVPEKFLLWFHRVGWDHPMKSGRTLWEELVHKYYEGVEQVRWMRRTWDSIQGSIDNERFEHVRALLKIQEKDAVIWRDSCVLYFQTHSGQPIPNEYEKPVHSLDYYMELSRNRYIPSVTYGW